MWDRAQKLACAILLTASGIAPAASMPNLIGTTYQCSNAQFNYRIHFDEVIDGDADSRASYLTTVTQYGNQLPQRAIAHLDPIATRCVSGWVLSTSLKHAQHITIRQVSYDLCDFPGDAEGAWITVNGERSELTCTPIADPAAVPASDVPQGCYIP